MDFSEKLINFRAKCNLSQVETADLLGVTPFMIYQYEVKKTIPHKKNLIRFEHIMEVWENAKNKQET